MVMIPAINQIRLPELLAVCCLLVWLGFALLAMFSNHTSLIFAQYNDTWVCWHCQMPYTVV
jgi:hypothetical protein